MHYIHGDAESPEWFVWYEMLRRCNDSNPRRRTYKYYAGRGIKVCKRWHQYANFLADMGRKPSPAHQIERKNNDGHYTPKNCKWATAEEQGRNTSRTRLYIFRGRTQCVLDWAIELGMNYGTLQTRLNNGWPTRRAFTEPVHANGRGRRSG